MNWKEIYRAYKENRETEYMQVVENIITWVKLWLIKENLCEVLLHKEEAREQFKIFRTQENEWDWK